MPNGKYLKQNGEVIYPITMVDNVIGSNNNSLTTILSNLTAFDKISVGRVDYAASANMGSFSFSNQTGRFSLNNTDKCITCLETGTYLIMTDINIQSKMSSNYRVYAHLRINSVDVAHIITYGQFGTASFIWAGDLNQNDLIKFWCSEAYEVGGGSVNPSTIYIFKLS